MWRVLIVVGLTVATVASAEARGFGRFSTRVRVSPSSRLFAHPGERKIVPAALVFRKDRDERTPRPPVASILDHPERVASRSPASPIPQAGKAADRSAHWCDNGKLVGTGAGFCVLDVGTGASS